jgi:hypothetical protein
MRSLAWGQSVAIDEENRTMRHLFPTILAVLLSFWSVSAAALPLAFDADGGNGTLADNSTGNSLSFVIIGDSIFDGQDRRTRVVAIADRHYAVSGTFAYATGDILALFDRLGLFVAGMDTQLSDDFGESQQTGAFAFTVVPGQEFGWYLDSDGFAPSPAQAGVQATLEVVPLPASLLLLLAAAGMLAAVGRPR